MAEATTKHGDSRSYKSVHTCQAHDMILNARTNTLSDAECRLLNRLREYIRMVESETFFAEQRVDVLRKKVASPKYQELIEVMYLVMGTPLLMLQLRGTKVSVDIKGKNTYIWSITEIIQLIPAAKDVLSVQIAKRTSKKPKYRYDV